MADAAQLNFRHLAAFAQVVRLGTLGAAARAVNLTQPAITQAMAGLERQIGLPLFDRSSGMLVATDAARALALRAESAVRLLGTRRATSAQVRAFLALSRHGSYSSAASATGLAEASIHRAVADLALATGIRLVERRGRGIALTGRGVQVARNFSLAVAELRSGLAEFMALNGQEVGGIAIGAMPLSRARLLPEAVAAFRRDHPHVRFTITEGSHEELMGPLRDGDIDLMVGALRDPAPGADVVQTALFVDRPVIVARPGHPLAAGREPVAAADLGRYAWVVPPAGTPLRALWTQIFVHAGCDIPEVPIECGSVIMIRQLLLDSDFLTLLSPDQVAVEIEAGCLVQLGFAPGTAGRTIGLTSRADWRPTPLQKAFLLQLHKHADRIGVAVGNS
ncbi:MAG TPA: LysR family transcriptional regulator [Novosphingobium sp.]|nr:LysR family transcriptional regulator [Novosphingobium sp.]